MTRSYPSTVLTKIKRYHLGCLTLSDPENKMTGGCALLYKPTVAAITRYIAYFWPGAATGKEKILDPHRPLKVYIVEYHFTCTVKT